MSSKRWSLSIEIAFSYAEHAFSKSSSLRRRQRVPERGWAIKLCGRGCDRGGGGDIGLQRHPGGRRAFKWLCGRKEGGWVGLGMWGGIGKAATGKTLKFLLNPNSISDWRRSLRSHLKEIADTKLGFQRTQSTFRRDTKPVKSEYHKPATLRLISTADEPKRREARCMPGGGGEHRLRVMARYM